MTRDELRAVIRPVASRLNALNQRIQELKEQRSALNLEDLSVEHDGHGNITLTFKGGEQSRSFGLRIPCFEYRGTFVDGQKYLSGHGVTSGGSFWIAMKDGARGRPGDNGTDWILAVKKGRDGSVKPGKNGEE